MIAAVHGHCLGGGLQIALGADIRIVHPDAKLSVLEIRWGLSPDMTATATLPRLVGIDVAKELTWTGRNVSGTEAVALGLCTRASDDPLADALALARDIAGRSPGAIRGTKRLLEQSGQVPLAQQYADERHTIASLIGTPNQVEAVAAFFEKRARPSPTRRLDTTDTTDTADTGPSRRPRCGEASRPRTGQPPRCSSAARWCWCG